MRPVRLAANRWTAAAWVVLAAAIFVGAATAVPTSGPVVPNDPYWSTQASLQQMGMAAAWGATIGSPNVVIAVVDTGVQTIPDLNGALVPGWDFVEDDAVPQDAHGHGTEVASLIAARGNDGDGIAGVCWACKVMPIRVAAAGTASPDQVALGIRWAADHGAQIVNVSLVGSGGPSEAQAVAYAQAHGVLVVAAAGNSGDTTPGYPAAYPGVLAVAATGADDQLFSWSTRGQWVSLAAPGCSIVDNMNGPPDSLCGTSLAPALVSGLAGLLLSADPTLTGPALAVALRLGAVPVVGIAGGRVDAAAAIAAVTDAARASSSDPAYNLEARLMRGTVRGTWRTALQLGPGPIRVELRSHRVAGCRVELRAPDALLVGLPTRKDEIKLAAAATGGRYLVTVACAGPARRNFTLLLYASVQR